MYGIDKRLRKSPGVLGDSTAQVRTAINRGLRAVADVLFPPVCTLCGTPGVDAAHWICAPCAATIERQCRTTYCPTCARTVPPFAVSGGRCHRCRDRKVRVAGVVRAGSYAGPLGALLRAFKYRRHWTLGLHLGDRVVAEFERTSWFQSVDALVTVPPWWRGRILAGDYAPTILARRASDRTGVPLIPALRRIKGGPSQIGLTAAQRIQNVRGKFAMTRGVRVDGATFCLIDDVTTTGATLEECARILLRAGAGRIYAGVVAHVSRDTPALPAYAQPPEKVGEDT